MIVTPIIIFFVKRVSFKSLNITKNDFHQWISIIYFSLCTSGIWLYKRLTSQGHKWQMDVFYRPSFETPVKSYRIVSHRIESLWLPPTLCSQRPRRRLQLNYCSSSDDICALSPDTFPFLGFSTRKRFSLSAKMCRTLKRVKVRFLWRKATSQ